jgi:hypothetical protein
MTRLHNNLPLNMTGGFTFPEIAPADAAKALQYLRECRDQIDAFVWPFTTESQGALSALPNLSLVMDPLANLSWSATAAANYLDGVITALEDSAETSPNGPLIRRLLSPGQQEAPEEERFAYGEPPNPQDVAEAQYTLVMPPHFAANPTIPATIIHDVDGNASFIVTVTFPGRPDLDDIGPFLVGLDGPEIEQVEIRCFEQEAGELDELEELPGCIKGVFQAIIDTHRDWLDGLRMTVAYLNEIRLEPRNTDKETA